MVTVRGLKIGCALFGATIGGQALAKGYIVKFKTQEQTLAAGSQATFAGGSVKELYLKGQLLKLDFSAAESLTSDAEQIAKLLQRPDVAYVVEDFKLGFLDDRGGTRIDEQWALRRIGAAEAWKRGVGAKTVTVAVIDSGVDYTHADLKDNIYVNPGEIAGNGIDDDHNGFIDDVHGWNFLDNDNDPKDVTRSGGNPGHGTHCAGVIGAVGMSNGTYGISQKVSVMPLRFIGPDGAGDLMAAIRAIDYAVLMKADIISASWGGKVPPAQAQPLVEAVGRANAAGVIFVAAAGNDMGDNDINDLFPANAPYPNVISVGASDFDDGRAIFSNDGKVRVALSAPGVDILSTLPDNSYGPLSGTSMSAPLVAGLIGLLKAQQKETFNLTSTLTGPQARALLQSTGKTIAMITACRCRIDASAASAALTSNQLLLVPTATTFAQGVSGQFSALGGAGGYTYQSSNPAVLDVKADGTLNAKSEGEVSVTVTDSKGASAKSLALFVGERQDDSAKKGCSLGKDLCKLICLFDPTQPWCDKNAL